MNDLTLQTAGSWLLRLREDKLSDAEMSEWIEWCEASPENLRTFEELQSLWRLAGENPPPSGQIADLLLGNAPTSRHIVEEKRGVRLFRAPRFWAVAAALALMTVGVGLWVGTAHWSENSASIEPIAAVAVVRTPLAKNRQGLLPDGSHVDIAARTVLDVDFSADRRRLELRDGQAFFRVKHDKTRPFIVSAGDIQVVAVGTSFDVRHSASQVAVTVQEGTVRIINRQDDSLTATAGDQLVFDPRSGKVRKSSVNPAAAATWRSGRLEFSGDPLDVVIASINRYSKHPVVLSDPALGKLTFTGTVFTGSIDASLDALEQVFPIQVLHTETETQLTRRQ